VRLRTVLHPTDFSDGARRALELAVDLAVEHGATLHLFHAVLLHGIEDPARKTEELDALAETTRLMASRATEVQGHEPRIAVETSHARGVFAAESILARATEIGPDLIVMGTHGRSGLSKLLMGSTAEKVLRHATCSVVTVRPDIHASRGPFRSLLVPVDFSESSGRALDAARKMAPDTTLHLHHVVEPIPPIYYSGDVTSMLALDGGLRNRVEEKLREWSGDHPRARLHITEGSPAAEIVRVAEQIPADLIVMSTRGLTGLEHVLVGSVTERVCRLAKVPVLTVR
jgi:nucleotide-binding universal stress UspA family protein